MPWHSLPQHQWAESPCRQGLLSNDVEAVPKVQKMNDIRALRGKIVDLGSIRWKSSRPMPGILTLNFAQAILTPVNHADFLFHLTQIQIALLKAICLLIAIGV
jgi:hypothetical protein